MVRDESEVIELLHTDRASSVTGSDPCLDTGTIVGLASAKDNRVTHQFKRDGATEVQRYGGGKRQGRRGSTRGGHGQTKAQASSTMAASLLDRKSVV